MRNSSFYLVLALAVAGVGCTVIDNSANDAASGDDTGTIDSAPSDSAPSDTGAGNDASDASDASPPPTADDACADWAQRFCAKYLACSEFEFTTKYDTLSMCVAATAGRCLDQLGSSAAKITPAWQAACTADFETLDCHLVASDYLPSSCKPAAGTVANAGFCAWDSDCASGYCSHVDQAHGASCGLCAAAPKAGEACAGKQKDECGFGLSCVGAKCARRVDVGASCADPSACLAGYECYQGKCVVGLKGGVDCDFVGDTTPPCDSSSGVVCGLGGATVCNGPAIGTAGDMCTTAISWRCPAGPCDATTGTCPGFLPEGGDCTGDISCAPGAICVAGLCKTPEAKTCL